MMDVKSIQVGDVYRWKDNAAEFRVVMIDATADSKMLFHVEVTDPRRTSDYRDAITYPEEIMDQQGWTRLEEGTMHTVGLCPECEHNSVPDRDYICESCRWG